MFSRMSSFLVWALVAGSAVFWGMKFMASPMSVPAQASLALPSLNAGADLARLVGAEPAVAPPVADAPPPESSRFQLIGVVTPQRAAAGAQGVALIAVDGKMPRAIRVGAVVDGDQVLKSVLARSVSIGPADGPAKLSLELPPLPPPATGVPGSAAPVPFTQALPVKPPPGRFQGLNAGRMPQLSAAQQARLRSMRGLPAGGPVPGAPAPQLQVVPAPTDVAGESRRQR
jgi:general secretion pathway protein C